MHVYDSGWSGWNSYSRPTGYYFTGGCSVAFDTTGNVKEMYAVADYNEGTLWCKYWDSDHWSGWNSYGRPLGYGFTGAPSVAFDTSGNVQEMYAVNTNGYLWCKYWDNGWSSWTSYDHPTGYFFEGGCSVAFNTSGNVYEMYAVADNGSLYRNNYNNGWSGWTSYGHPESPDYYFIGGCSVAFNTSGSVQEMYAIADDGSLWCYAWSGWSRP